MCVVEHAWERIPRTLHAKGELQLTGMVGLDYHTACIPISIETIGP